MSDILIHPTPNPNAMKFTVLMPGYQNAPKQYDSKKDAGDHPSIAALFDLAGVKSVFAVSNFITVTQDGNADWNRLAPAIRDTLLNGLKK